MSTVDVDWHTWTTVFATEGTRHPTIHACSIQLFKPHLIVLGRALLGSFLCTARFENLSPVRRLGILVLELRRNCSKDLKNCLLSHSFFSKDFGSLASTWLHCGQSEVIGLYLEVQKAELTALCSSTLQSFRKEITKWPGFPRTRRTDCEQVE